MTLRDNRLQLILAHRLPTGLKNQKFTGIQQLETFKASVRLFVLAFVIVGAMVTLAGPGSTKSDSTSVTVDKEEQDKSYAKSSKDLVKVELGSTG